MSTQLFSEIKTITELVGPIGQEGAVLDYVEKLWREAGAQTERTKIGNLIARVPGKGPKVLLVAHADELCYMVRSIHPDGFLMLANGQRWERKVTMREGFTIGQNVHILARSGIISGVIASTTGHLAALSLPEPQEMTWNDFWVDTGLTREELLARGVTPGTRVVWDAQTVMRGQQITGKALDDRVPLLAITEVLRRVPAEERNCELVLAATVQEEIGVIGAFALAATEKFDAAIVVEIGMAGDTPSVREDMMPLRLGKGPVLVHKDALVHYDYALTQRLEQVAAQANIPIQHAVFGSFGSDGSALIKADIPSALVAFPVRYTHTPFETGHMADIEAMIDWLCACVRDGLATS